MLKNISCLWAVISTITILQACAGRSPTIPLAGEISADAADYVIIEGTVGNSRYRVLSYNPLGMFF